MSEEIILIVNLLIKYITSIFCIYNGYEILVDFMKTKIKMKLAIIILYISIGITPILFAFNLLIEMDFMFLYQINLLFGIITSISLVYLANKIYLNDVKNSDMIKRIYIYILLTIEFSTLILSLFNLSEYLIIVLVIYALVMLSLYATLLYYSITLYKFLKKDKESNIKEKSYLKSLILMLIFLTIFLVIGINTVDLSGNINQVSEIINGIVLLIAVYYSYKSFVVPVKLKRNKE